MFNFIPYILEILKEGNFPFFQGLLMLERKCSLYTSLVLFIQSKKMKSDLKVFGSRPCLQWLKFQDIEFTKCRKGQKPQKLRLCNMSRIFYSCCACVTLSRQSYLDIFNLVYFFLTWCRKEKKRWKRSSMNFS